MGSVHSVIVDASTWPRLKIEAATTATSSTENTYRRIEWTDITLTEANSVRAIMTCDLPLQRETRRNTAFRSWNGCARVGLLVRTHQDLNRRSPSFFGSVCVGRLVRAS